ncbi:Tfp pilus assembly protein PilN [Herbaspirillum sp. Sphag1AN]|uniref:PilN domain-containing protein n=1 Tax=unclassified Herbaspirillum TaxID=2624150 RepID=UPI00161F1BD4|nr:Tfp pilus assembly protein PilN [Herbaspirillum sp. Sphag1AN]MBB3245788.1 Tfp pilus assembly protein PilN [Herbaspirillum sp. Sphag64]
MIRFNLLPRHERRSRREQQRYQRWLAVLLISASVIILCNWLILEQQHERQRERLQLLRQAHQQQDQHIALRQQIQQDIVQLSKQRAALDSVQQQRTATVSLLTLLAMNTPPGIVLEQLSEEKQRLSLQGLADSHQDIADLLHALRQQYPSSLVDLQHTTKSGQRQAFLINVVTQNKEHDS